MSLKLYTMCLSLMIEKENKPELLVFWWTLCFCRDQIIQFLLWKKVIEKFKKALDVFVLLNVLKYQWLIYLVFFCTSMHLMFNVSVAGLKLSAIVWNDAIDFGTAVYLSCIRLIMLLKILHFCVYLHTWSINLGSETAKTLSYFSF